MPRESFLARDRARSAFFRSFSDSSPSPGDIAMPMLAPITTECPSRQKGIADGVQQAPRQERGILGPRHPALHDRELVGIEPRQRVVVAQHRSQALADAAQQLVADAVTERVVDRLEMVEAEHQHRHLLGAAARCAAGRRPSAGAADCGSAARSGASCWAMNVEPRLGALAFGGVDQRRAGRRARSS